MTINLLACPESCVCFAVAIVVIVIVSLLKEDVFRPSTLYILVQAVMLGVAYLKLVPAMSDFKLNTWLVWGGGAASFIVACFLTDLAWKMAGGPPLPAKVSIHGEYNWVRHFFLSFLAFGYFFIGVLGVISIAGNLVLLTDKPYMWLDGAHSPVLEYAGYFTSGAMVVALFAVGAFKSMNPVRWVRYASRFMVVFTILLSFATFPSRGINMLCLGMVLLLIHFLHGRFTWKSLLVVAAFVFVFFIAVASLKGQYGDSSTDVTDNKVVKNLSLLPYMYVANNYWNLDYAFNRTSDIPEHSWTYGIDAFYGLTHILQIGDGLQTSFGWDTPFNESIVKSRGLNTVPYLWDAYKDFGYPGIFLVPFFFGVLFTFMYHHLAQLKSPLGLLFFCTFMLWVILWNFTTGYKQSMYWTWFGFFVLVCTLSTGKGSLIPRFTKGGNVPMLDSDKTPAGEVDEKRRIQHDVAGEGEQGNETVG